MLYDINPFPRYFPDWDRDDTHTLNNILRPLLTRADGRQGRVERDKAYTDRLLQLLGKFGVNRNERISVDDWDRLNVDLLEARGEKLGGFAREARVRELLREGREFCGLNGIRPAKWLAVMKERLVHREAIDFRAIENLERRYADMAWAL